VNDLGVLVGERAVAPIGGGTYQAFRLINGTEQFVSLLAGYPNSYGIAINNWNDVAGAAYDIANPAATRAFLNTLNGTEDLDTLGGPSFATGVNDRREVVGYSAPANYVPTNSAY